MLQQLLNSHLSAIKSAKKLTDLASGFTNLALVITAGAYTLMACRYGPLDAGTVIYAEITGNHSLKHRNIEDAKFIYANQQLKKDLSTQDLKRFYYELGVVESENKQTSDDDVSWFQLTKWLDKNKDVEIKSWDTLVNP